MTRRTAILIASLLLVGAGCKKTGSGTASSGGTATSGSASPSSTVFARPATDAPPASKIEQDAIREAIQQHLAGNTSINMG
jgi:hypothetical protein